MTNFKEDLAKVEAFVFDIDGVLSLQTISLNSFGVPGRTVNLRDGYAVQLAVKKGYRVAVISGSNAKDYQKRLRQLGVKDVYLNSRSKIEHFNEQMLFSPSPTGTIFNLKNNYGWKDKTEQEISNPDGSLNPYNTLSAEELRKLAGK